jgi:hypothetical protein
MMKSLSQAGVSLSGHLCRWSLCALLVGAAAGCGGGSDPLGLDEDSSGSSSIGQDQLINAYNKVSCGMKGEEAEKLVGAKTDIDFFSWQWTSDDGNVKLYVSAVNDKNWNDHLGFPNDGYYRAKDASLTYVRKGQTISRSLCE